jgi:hypothetical protein
MKIIGYDFGINFYGKRIDNRATKYDGLPVPQAIIKSTKVYPWPSQVVLGICDR